MSKWVALPGTSVPAEQLPSQERGGMGPKPCPQVSLLPTMVWLSVCVSSMWHKAAGCTPELGKPQLLTECSSLYSKRSCAVHPLKLVKSNEKSCLSKANFVWL